MLLRYVVMVPIQLRSRPCKRPPTTQPRQLETRTRTRFRNAEVSPLLFGSAEPALHKAYPSQRWAARFLCQLAQKRFYPPSPRAELVPESLGPSACVSPGWHRGGWAHSPPADTQPLFRSLLRDVLPTAREGAVAKCRGSLGTAPSSARKG